MRRKNLSGKLHYLPNDNRWEIGKRGLAYKVNPELVTMNLAVRSLQLVSFFLPLTQEEAREIIGELIRRHNHEWTLERFE